MPSINIILFGETGHGKTSLINLIAGRTIVDVSPDVDGCTLQSKEYKFDVDSMRVSIWDTVGLEEPEMGTNAYLPAIEKAWLLIKRLGEAGGIDLLLFCIRGNRVTMTTQSNYRLFYEVLCGQHVPIAVVITHLEREVVMEDWWTRNHKSIERYGMKFAGHACVTAQPDNRGPRGKYWQSQMAVLALLQQHDGSGRFTMPEEVWLARIINRLKSFIGNTTGIPKGKNLEKALVKRCGMDPELARKVVRKLDD